MLKPDSNPGSPSCSRKALAPPQLKVGDRTYQLAKSEGEGSWIASIPFARVPGKTDKFMLYLSVDKARPEILLHTPQTLRLRNPIARKSFPWVYSSLLDPLSLRLPVGPLIDHSYFKRVLQYDKVTESDSLRFFNYVVFMGGDMPGEFWPVLVLWLRDEINHCRGFTQAYHQLFGYDIAEEHQLDAEESDFEQFGSILRDPFATLIALAYDEASTIAGYKHDMPIYRALGPSMAAFVNRVAADEGWHLAKFLHLALKHFPSQLRRTSEILSQVICLDGRPYKRTFLLDHDPRVEAQFDISSKERAAATLIEIIRKRTHKLEPPPRLRGF